jgi:metal-sulfur cluster biosynthetic enzyme
MTTPFTAQEIRQSVLDALQRVEDPCMASAGIDLSVLDLGLLAGLRVDGTRVEAEITFTELGCSFTHRVLDQVERAIAAVPGVDEVEVRPTWTPRWAPDRLSERATKAIEASNRRLEGLKVTQLDGAAGSDAAPAIPR